MEGKIKGLAAGYGTVTFFENQDIWDQLVEDSPRSKPMVEPWGNVVSGMLQYTGELLNFVFGACLLCLNK